LDFSKYKLWEGGGHWLQETPPWAGISAASDEIFVRLSLMEVNILVPVCDSVGFRHSSRHARTPAAAAWYVSRGYCIIIIIIIIEI